MDRNLLLRLYRSMATIRRFEARLHETSSDGLMPGFVHLYEGEEASAAGVCVHLRPTDHVTSTHRAHGHYLAKGGDLEGLVLELYGRAGAICNGKAGSMHVADWSVGMMGANGIVGASVPHAVGAAFSASFLGTDRVAVAFGGDGAANQGVLFESMNLARVFNLPVIFVTEDNGYAETTASRWSIGGPGMAARAEAFGIPAIAVDGADVFAVEAAARTAIDRARGGDGPSYLVIDVPMFRGHFEGDTETYRRKGEVREQRRERDCLKRFRARVVAEAWLDLDALEPIDCEVDARIEAAFERAEAAPELGTAALMTNVFVN